MKKIILIIVALVIVGSGAFYGGMKYGQSTSQNLAFDSKTGIGGLPQNFQNLSEEQRQQLSQGRTARGTGAGFLAGEVIVKNEQSLTLKMPDGSSKIVFFSASAQISKTAEGSIDDIEIGKQIMITGQQNSDGSYTAKTIQLSPRYLIPEK